MARCLNKVMIIGYLGRDPELRFTPTGKSVSSFSVACNRSWKAKDGERKTETDWFNVVAWGDLAEITKQYLSKGSMVYVEGRLQIRDWTDSNGNSQKSVEIVARDIMLMDSKSQNLDKDLEDEEEFPF
jgi:single-strand DNA-binding protein